ncbi:hypothetical protein F2Q68_00025842 [Brassica cretica]|uniref:Uncharacterized protein n=2 Tax=Brassica cretica TaxID=69181 RepID=A0A8S9QVT6_BRACR|nr:hypothetical protein F2Q68_00025842 [Brassica cretica]KAF3554499.1 hypothetical protein F2Q69_00014160 [Brassica cretica]KAF3578516.1 hypothetical protein DY000_02031808 [Brassica cretica]
MMNGGGFHIDESKLVFVHHSRTFVTIIKGIYGGPGNDVDDDDSGDDGDGDILIPNQGVVIEEIEEEEDQAEDGDAEEENQEAYESNIAAMEEEADDEDIWTSNAMRRMYTDDVISEEMHNPIDPFGLKEQAASTLKRMTWLSDTNGQTSKFNKRERGNISQHGNAAT